MCYGNGLPLLFTTLHCLVLEPRTLYPIKYARSFIVLCSFMVITAMVFHGNVECKTILKDMGDLITWFMTVQIRSGWHGNSKRLWGIIISQRSSYRVWPLHLFLEIRFRVFHGCNIYVPHALAKSCRINDALTNTLELKLYFDDIV